MKRRFGGRLQESGASWDDRWLDRVPMEALFGLSAEKVAEFIMTRTL